MAHGNEIPHFDEALLISKHEASSVRFVRAVEARDKAFTYAPVAADGDLQL
jgi:hypothetical protein